MPHSRGVLLGTRFATFADIERRALRIANGLAAIGIEPGDCVTILMRNDAAFFEISYGVMRLGAS
jgi:long-chain acyl-CoA synthetase